MLICSLKTWKVLEAVITRDISISTFGNRHNDRMTLSSGKLICHERIIAAKYCVMVTNESPINRNDKCFLFRLLFIYDLDGWR